MIRHISTLLLVGAAACATLCARDYYVASDGRASGDGSIEDPWDLATALAHPRIVIPGDRILVREGVYRGPYRSTLVGTISAPIVVRPHANERVTLDRHGQDSRNQAALTVLGSHAWFWGFEITNTDPVRVHSNSFVECVDREHCRPPAVMVLGAGTKVINLVIHDTGDGIGMWSPAVDAEAYGNIIFYTGWQSEVRGSGHALYAQNDTGTKRVVDNVMFSGFHSGVHLYGSAVSSLRNVHLEGNTIFNTGLLASDPNGWGILVGGGSIAENVSMVSNYVYNPAWYKRGNNLNPSWGNGANRVLLENNYSAGYRALGSDLVPSELRASGNVFAGIVDRELAAAIGGQPDNIIDSFESMAGKPNRIFIRRNKYEPEKAIVTVFNWQGSSDVDLDLSSLLGSGDSYEIVDVQNYFGPPVRTGVFDGRPVSVPMLSGSGSPVGSVPGTRFRTGVEFGVFQIRVKPDAGGTDGELGAGPDLRRRIPHRGRRDDTEEELRVAPGSLRFSVAGNRGAAARQTLLVSPGSAERVTWQAASEAPWIRLARPDLLDVERLFVSVDTTGMAPGSYHSKIALTPDSGRVRSVAVSLTVADAAIAPSIDAVSNAASGFPDLAAGTLFAIQGSNLSKGEYVAPAGEPLPAELGGTRVSVGGAPTYLLAVSPTRVLAVAQAPLRAVLDSPGVELVIETPEAVASAFVPAATVSVGIWEWDTPPGHIVATRADGTVVSAQDETPARPGDHISLYVTGLRAPDVDWAASFAAPRPASGHVEVLFGGVPGIVTYAGVTHPGVAHVDVVVPALPAGRHPVVMRYQKAISQPSAYLQIAE